MALTLNFKELNKGDAHRAGGKGASLGEMTQANIPVPPGFVVLSTTFDQFIKDADLLQEIEAALDKVDHKEIHTVESASETIQALIKNASMPENIAKEISERFRDLDSEYVAVRSSATAEDGQDHAWAGQLDSFLNTTEKTLMEKVQHCWASLFTPRAIFYRFEKGLHTTQISVAVVVQKMVQSEVSGIAFSVHPVTEDRNQLIIEAGYGLGEAIVSGSITPDSYVVEKEPRRIVDTNISTQKRGLFKAEKGGNEWKNIDEPQASSQVLTEKQVHELSNLIIKIENHYSFPCDIEWAFESGNFYITQSRPITTLKSIAIPPVNPYGFKKGEEYFTLGQWVSPVLELEAWLDWFKTTEAKLVGLQSNDPAIVLNGHYFFQKEGVYTELKRKMDKEFETGNFDLTLKILALAEKLSNECIEMAHAIGPNPTFEDFLKAFNLMSRLRFPWMACFPIGDSGEEFVNKYAAKQGLNSSKTLELIPQLSNSVNEDQKKLAEFKARIALEHLSFDLDIVKKANPELAKEINKYQEETEYVGTHHFWGEERDIHRLMEAIKNAGPVSTAGKTEKSEVEAFNIIAETTKWRLECAQTSAFLAYAFRPFMTELANKNGITYDDLIYLTTSEIKNLVENKKEIIPPVSERQKTVGVLKVDGKIIIVVGKELEELEKHFGLSNTHESVEEIKGAIGNKGIVRGIVAIVLKPSDQVKVMQGTILVAPETTPDYIPSMGKAAAFVTDQGGITSHAAIVAREMGKPCITGTKIATKVLKDGDMVEVDADKGIVRIL